MTDSRFEAGELVLLTSQKGKTWLVRAGEGPFSSHLGNVDLNDVVGRQEGECLETNQGAKVFLFRPSLTDYVFKLKRKTQIIYPKDMGAFVVYGDIRPGDRVLESGIGSGALTLALLRAVGPTGTVVSVEKRPEFAQLARRHIERFLGRPPKNHRLVVGDIESVPLRCTVDRLVLDVPEPWHAVGPASRQLRTGGLLISWSPNVGQVQLVCRELKAHGFANVTTFELLKRNWKIDERRARPEDRMVAHTGFITVAKKIVRTVGETPPAIRDPEAPVPR
ncbi:tRNA (adenine-58-N(1)-) methyltransferase [Desulfacinum hydrothermale DSM 13146]|uniref:tRNA (adenine(58)-N(1))-methyltransferase TrmI n=1 Tax=Desulfacinum hydrothermale DSM 13146 TaxID=1121390 RepID=A0A1W1X009_9BACT|nr:tRNA (adenine-N1)-methyltransferase [Desulfacinum hydrothermale]SMC17299.1 tRNA (adenine-58-N(1)-) methyltransferase [Desulfacinum hydrothermale DSM 13146]